MDELKYFTCEGNEEFSLISAQSKILKYGMQGLSWIEQIKRISLYKKILYRLKMTK
jgi:hypothetical protein